MDWIFHWNLDKCWGALSIFMCVRDKKESWLLSSLPPWFHSILVPFHSICFSVILWDMHPHVYQDPPSLYTASIIESLIIQTCLFALEAKLSLFVSNYLRFSRGVSDSTIWQMADFILHLTELKLAYVCSVKLAVGSWCYLL